MDSVIKPMIESMNKLGADNQRAMFDVEIDGQKYWIHIDIVKKENEEHGAPENDNQND